MMIQNRQAKVSFCFLPLMQKQPDDHREDRNAENDDDDSIAAFEASFVARRHTIIIWYAFGFFFCCRF